MTTYAGPTSVTAVSMTRQAYYTSIGSTKPTEENGADTGYLVSLPTGGDVWMTTAKFTANFTALGSSPTESADTAELALAQDRFDRLSTYIASLGRNEVSYEELIDLRAQRHAMKRYINALTERLARY